MIPDHTLSSRVIEATFQPPKNVRPPSKLIAYDMGGIALQDPSQGLLVQVWTAEYTGGSVYVSAPTVASTLLFTRSGITEISLTFDQNMRPFVAFVQDGLSKFWWYDTSIAAPRFSDLGASDRSPRAVLDDKRPLENGSSDIILGYTRNGGLYTRIQRDRYEIEYILRLGVQGNLVQIGMNEVSRLQFLMDIPDDHPCSFG